MKYFRFPIHRKFSVPNCLILPLFKRAAMIPEEMRWLFQQNLKKQGSSSGFGRPAPENLIAKGRRID